MISPRKPTPQALRRFLDQQQQRELSYKDIGATSGTPPPGHVVDRTRTALGSGEAVYREGVAAMRRWDQFRLGWVETWPPEAPLRIGETVAVIGFAMGLYWVNACRIVQVIDDQGERTRFGFAYGTLPDHVESGEERFLIEWDRSTGQVSYEILAFSRPNRVAAWIGYPFVRRTQKRFARDSAQAMRHAVRQATLAPEDPSPSP